MYLRQWPITSCLWLAVAGSAEVCVRCLWRWLPIPVIGWFPKATVPIHKTQTPTARLTPPPEHVFVRHHCSQRENAGSVLENTHTELSLCFIWDFCYKRQRTRGYTAIKGRKKWRQRKTVHLFSKAFGVGRKVYWKSLFAHTHLNAPLFHSLLHFPHVAQQVS